MLLLVLECRPCPRCLKTSQHWIQVSRNVTYGVTDRKILTDPISSSICFPLLSCVNALTPSINKKSESEQIVQEALDKLLNGKDASNDNKITTLVIAHRLQTVRNADLIAVLQDGRVVEVGNHDSLMRLENGYYKSMIDKSRGSDKFVE